MENEKIKILIITAHFDPMIGGYALAATNLVKAIDKYSNKIDYTVSTNIQLENASELKLSKGRIVRLKFFKKWGLWSFFIYEIRLFFTILRLNKKEKYDFIFFETMERTITLFLLSFTKLITKTGYRIHAATETERFLWFGKINKIRKWFLLSAVKKVKYIFSTNQYHLDFYKKYYLRDNIYKIADKFFFVLENIIIQQKLDIDNNFLSKLKLEENKFFLSLGRMSYSGSLEKGFIDLIAAVFLIKNNQKDLLNDIKFVLVGDGKYRKKLIKTVNLLNLDKYFIFLKKLENNKIHFLASKAKATVLLSRLEGMSMFALECLKNGGLLLFTRVGGIQHLIKPEKNGFLTEPQNIFDIKNKIVKILQLNEEEIKKMKLNSTNIFNSQFNPSKIVFKFENIMDFLKSITKL